jgi:hypothetical protein
VSSNTCAEKRTAKPEEILADLRRVKMLYLGTSGVSKYAWGHGGIDIQSLECSDTQVDSHVAESLFEVAKRKYGVDFGNGEYGSCFQIGKKYFWLVQVLQKLNSEPNSGPVVRMLNGESLEDL